MFRRTVKLFICYGLSTQHKNVQLIEAVMFHNHRNYPEFYIRYKNAIIIDYSKYVKGNTQNIYIYVFNMLQIVDNDIILIFHMKLRVI